MSTAFDRRRFLGASAGLAAGLFASEVSAQEAKAKAADPLRIGLMGAGGRGKQLVSTYSKLEGAEIAAVCDPDRDRLAVAATQIGKLTGTDPRAETDFRRLLDDKAIDILICAAPNHWHGPATILACGAGKHVYVEKPACHNPNEGELMIAAARKHGRCVQVGTQRRSNAAINEGIKLVHEGAIGTPYYARAWYANQRGPIGHAEVSEPPAELNYDLWQGPAPRKPYKSNYLHYNWHWFWHWGTGESCNNGTHEIDCCRWFLGVDYPTKVTSSGGRYAFKDDWQTPDTQVASFEFGNKATITWESRSCNNFPVEGAGRGFIIYGTNGTLVNRGGGDYTILDAKNQVMKEVKSEVQADANNTISASGNLDLYHFENFIKAVRGEATLTSPVDEGHKSVLLCHLANIAQRTGTTLHCDPSNGHILDNKEAMALWRRTYEKGWEPKV